MQILIESLDQQMPCIMLAEEIQSNTGPIESAAMESVGFGTQTALAVKWADGNQFGYTFDNRDNLGKVVDTFIAHYRGEIH